jgi:hypothetical protein
VKRALFWFFAMSALLLLLSLPIGAVLFRNFFYEPRVGAVSTDLETLVPKIEDDLRAIAKRSPFENGTRLKNAAPFLLQHVALIDDSIEPFKTPSHLMLRDLFSQYPLWSTDEQQGAHLLKSPELAKIDTGWMADLDAFDHIELASEQPIKSHLERLSRLGSLERIVLMANLPALNAPELTKFAIVHVLQAKTSDSRRLAMGRMRKLAQLFQSEGTLLGQMAALATLGRERWLVEKLKIVSWPVYSREEIVRLRRVMWVWPGLFRLAESRGFPKALLPYLERRFGACAGAAEATAAGIDQLFDFLEPRFPFETSFADDLERSRSRKRQTLEACGLTSMLPLLQPVEAGVERSEWPLPPGTAGWYRHIPYIRRIVGMTINSTAIPDSTKVYKAD